MRRLVTYTLLVLVVLVAAATVGWMTWASSASRRLQQRVEELRSRGEPVSGADLTPAPVADEENGALVLQEAFRWLESSFPQGAAPPCLAEDPAGWSRAEAETARTYLRGLAPLEDRIREALARPGWDMGLDLQAGPAIDLRHVQPVLRCGRYLALRARLALLGPEGPDAAVELLRLGLELAERLEEKLLLTYLVRVSMQHHVLDVLTHVLRDERFDARAARVQLDGLLAQAEERRWVVEALRGERAFGLICIEQVIEGQAPDLLPPRAAVLKPLLYQEACLYLDYCDRAIPLFEEPYHEARDALAALHREYEQAMIMHPFLGSRSLVPVLEHLGGKAAVLRTRLRLARLALACHQFHQEHGVWPATLEELGALLPGPLPEDPLTGEALLLTEMEEGLTLISPGMGDPGCPIGPLEQPLHLCWILED